MASSSHDIFLSYAREDLGMATDIRDALAKRGLRLWFDKTNLRPGPWKPQITKAIASSRYFLILLSPSALSKTGLNPGFQDEELTVAFNIALQQGVTDFVIVPVRIEECGRGDHRLDSYQQYNLFPKDRREMLLDQLAMHLGGFARSLSNDHPARMLLDNHNPPLPPPWGKPIGSASLHVMGKSMIATTKEDRALRNVDVLDRFAHTTRHLVSKPIVRAYGLFSSLSSNREHKSIKSKYDELIIAEKQQMVNFVKEGYEVRLCISLDIPFILKGWGYTPEQLRHRVRRLSVVLTEMEAGYPNLCFAFDTHNRLPNTLVLGDALSIRAAPRVLPGCGYTDTQYDNCAISNANAIRMFDQVFDNAAQWDRYIRRSLAIPSTADFIRELVRHRSQGTIALS